MCIRDRIDGNKLYEMYSDEEEWIINDILLLNSMTLSVQELEGVAALEGEKTDLRRRLVEERREANEALAKEQAALAEANLARADGNLVRERAEQLGERLNALQSRVERTEAATRAEAEWTRKQLMDAYHELGARTGDFEVPDREPGLRCLEWIQEELLALPAIVEGFMSYASLVTCEGR